MSIFIEDHDKLQELPKTVPKIPISPGTGFVADASSSHIGRVSPTRACSASILLQLEQSRRVD